MEKDRKRERYLERRKKERRYIQKEIYKEMRK